jgi:hypothetical protein
MAIQSHLQKANWREFYPALLKHARRKVSRLAWKSGSDLLPKGHSAEDLALIAIQKTFEGTRRWDSASSPDLLAHLKSVIDSEVHHLVTSEEHRITDYGSESDPNHADTPERLYLVREERRPERSYEAFMKGLHEDFKDDPEVKALLESFEAQSRASPGIRPALVAEERGIPIPGVRNAIKRLRRRVEGRVVVFYRSVKGERSRFSGAPDR